MTVISGSVFEAALALPDEQRANLAYQLLGSLRPVGALSEDDDHFDLELERRMQAYEAGETTASSWDEVDARLTKSLAVRKSS